MSRTCPSDQASCNKEQNAGWNGTTCVCCNLNGSQYFDATTMTCLSCDGQTCGSQAGFCTGTVPGAPNLDCAKGPNGFEAVCSGRCEGTCAGSCGVGEWFTFSTCRENSGGIQSCNFSLSQWRSWVMYGLIFLLLVLVILLIVWVTHQTKSMVVVLKSEPAVVK